MTPSLLRLAALALLAGTGAAQAANCPPTSLAPITAPPAAMVGALYTHSFSAANSNTAPPFSYAVTGGLPAGSGLTLGSANGQLSGKPLLAGNYLITVTATDSAGCSGGRVYPLSVAQGSQSINFSTTPPANAQVGGAPYQLGVSATSALPVTVAIAAASSGVCAITGFDGIFSTIALQGTGNCVINASQPGDANWLAAAPAQQSFSIGLASQTISFTSTAPANAQFGGPAYTVAASATSGLPVSFSIDASAAGVCAIAGASVTFQGVGTCVINANQAGDASYGIAPQVQQSFAVGKADQTLGFTSTAPVNAQFGGAAYTVAATATSGLAVNFSIDASAAGVCALAGSSVTFQGVGTCVINANQAGDANHNAAPQVQQSFAVGKASQTVSFTSTAPANAQFGGAAYTVAATATSGLAVSFSIDASAAGVCALAGSSLTFQGVGTCVINANQPGNANYNAAPQVQQSFAVGKASQTVSFTSTAPSNAQFGGAAYTVAATATSGLAVNFSIDASAGSVCALAGSSVTFQGVGICVINANQAGDANYSAAPQIQQSFAVGKGNQTLTFTSTAPAAAAVAGATYTVAATASSGLTVSLSIDASASSICTLSGATVSFQGAGTCVINANQAGDANYNAAPQIQQSFAVGKGSQTLSFTSTAPASAAVAGATYTVAATASSGLSASFSIDASAGGVCAIAGSTVSFLGAGTCVINANQAGDANYNAAPQIQQSFAVGKGSQTVTFTSVAPLGAAVGGPAYPAGAVASSGLPVSFSIDAAAAGVCALSGSTVSFLHVGTCIVNANQAGDANWNAAPQAQQSFAVQPGLQFITFTSTPPAAVNQGPGYTVAATASSGLPVSFAIHADDAGVCAISGSTVSFIGAGACEIIASQPGNADWIAASDATQTVAVAKAGQTITFTSAPATPAVGASYTVAATASSGLAVTFSIDSTADGICSVAGDVVSFSAEGTCLINADQPGDANWNAAPQAQQSVEVLAAAACLTPALGEVVKGRLPDNSELCIENNSGAAMEFTYLPINHSSVGNIAVEVTASNVVAVTGPPTPRPGGDSAAAAAGLLALAEPALTDLHDQGVFPASAGGEPIDRSKLISRAKKIPQGPLTVGQLIDLNGGIGDGCSSTLNGRKGRVEAVTTPQHAGQAVLYAVQEVKETTTGSGVWVPALPGGFSTTDFQNIINVVAMNPPGQTPLGSAGSTGTPALWYTGAVDALADNFGLPADVDANNGVVIFFTSAVNAMSPPASSTLLYAAFLPRDLFSSAPGNCPNSNEGEIIYVMQPDPTGVVNSNVRTLSSVYNNAPAAIIHQLQHLSNASRRIYVNAAPSLEERWLDEALSGQLQELSFFKAAGLAVRSNLPVTALTTGPQASQRVQLFNMYENIMFGGVRSYFLQLLGGERMGPLRTNALAPGNHDYQWPHHTISAFFLRYALDRKATGDAAILSALMNSTLSGKANLQAVLGVDPDEWARDFLVAMYTDDAVAAAAPAYTAPTWNYRSVFIALVTNYPLAVNLLSDNTMANYSLGPGGGTRYTRFAVAAGQTATLTTTGSGGSPGSNLVSTALVRTK
ncbi:beta strand repeat-containing protein [Tahibacter harae]|uniref:Ig domain-containing protein n=1 Tax=Tahibacter harae TaxID=2963937 RepID=A0ABT1QM13_9GAMM|nr:Ig domain-containing protein [Tahibacter harae]MCQ4163571.1 Ig domain-containing protein [Tahibacter harae]